MEKTINLVEENRKGENEMKKNKSLLSDVTRGIIMAGAIFSIISYPIIVYMFSQMH